MPPSGATEHENYSPPREGRCERIRYREDCTAPSPLAPLPLGRGESKH